MFDSLKVRRRVCRGEVLDAWRGRCRIGSMQTGALVAGEGELAHQIAQFERQI
jgi:hypothetical protein